LPCNIHAAKHLASIFVIVKLPACCPCRLQYRKLPGTVVQWNLSGKDQNEIAHCHV
jgi:hypothetical protein